jgi:membrane associated rhomboid family serine protease
MIPITDIIPTRTPPAVTIVLIAGSVLLNAPFFSTSIGVLLFNMLFLWLFGWTVEDRLGHARFAALYLFCGAAGLVVSSPDVVVSSAVGGVMGAYFALYPRSSMLVLVPLPLTAVEIPVAVFLALWCLLHLLAGAIAAPFASFFAGAGLCLLMKRPERVRVEWWSP